MAVGDAATAAGYPLVPNTGEEGRVRWGAREINRTRDFVAAVLALIPTTLAAWRDKLAIRYGPTVPSNSEGVEGEIFLRVL